MTGAGEEPMCGVIEKIRLVNFMNHENFETTLCPHVNFICGENGSGKSAVLVAITLCLGATARFTKRAANVRGHVKHGRQFATVAVTLRNRGVDAYKPDEYGPSIVVERRISAEGASDWKLKASSGAVVSTKRKELVRLVDALGIQVDNPCGVLMQETSKRFLTGTRPDQLYKFFLEATQLAQMSQDYEAVAKFAEHAMTQIERKSQALPNLQKRVITLKAEHHDVRALDDIEAKIGEAEHADALRQRSVLQTTHDKLKRKEEHLRGELAAIQTRVDESMKDSAELQRALQAEEGRSKELAERSKELDRRFGSGKARIRALGTEIRTAERRLGTVEDELATLCIQQNDAGDATATQVAKIEADLEKIDSDLTRAQKDVSHAESKKANIDEEVRAADAKLRATQNSMRRVEGEEKALQSNTGDAELRAFGPEMPQIVKAIRDHAREFRHMPIGPIGALVRVKEHAKAWTRALDIAIGAHARSFLIDNHDDERRLRAVLASARVRVPPMIVQAFQAQPYDIPRAQRPQGETVLEALEWAEAMAHNAMVDQAGIEGMILVRDRTEAARRVFDAKDRRITCAIDADGTRYSLKGRTEVVQTAVSSAVRIATSRADRLGYLQQERLNLQRTQTQYEEELRRLQGAQRAAGAELGQAKAEITTLQRRRVQVRSDLSALQGQQAGSVGSAVDETIAQMEAQADELRFSISRSKTELETLTQETRALEADKEPLKAELQRHAIKVARLQERSEDVESKLRLALVARDNAEQILERVMIRGTQSDQQVHAAETRIKELADIVHSETEAAARIAERPENLSSDSAEKLEADQRRLTRSLQQGRAGQRPLDVVLEELVAAKERARQLREDVDALQTLQRTVAKNLRQRRSAWVDMCTRYANVAFQSYLYNRNFSGSTTFDHEQAKLFINVAPRQDDSEGGSTQGLSGGERSFSTVALLLALWESMEQPFSAMDEFDVFMDQVNRRMAVKMLIETCAQQHQRQFIFISPHTLAHLPNMDPASVKVIKMHPPERGQRTLAFASQATQ